MLAAHSRFSALGRAVVCSGELFFSTRADFCLQRRAVSQRARKLSFAVDDRLSKLWGPGRRQEPGRRPQAGGIHSRPYSVSGADGRAGYSGAAFLERAGGVGASRSSNVGRRPGRGQGAALAIFETFIYTLLFQRAIMQLRSRAAVRARGFSDGRSSGVFHAGRDGRNMLFGLPADAVSGGCDISEEQL